MFLKKVLDKQEGKNSGGGVLFLILKSFFASSEGFLKKAFTKNIKNSGDEVLFRKKVERLCFAILFIEKCA